jgi:hypothetical protein
MKRNCVLLGFLMLSNFAFSQTNVLNSTGNVGIGTLTPLAKLNVAVGAGGTNGIVGLMIGSISNYPSLELGIENNYEGMIRTYGNDLKIYAGNWRTLGATATEDHAMYFYTSKSGSPNWSTAKMVLNHEGNVGIGTTNPTEKLAVNGKIRAKEIKVETGWADFVFAKDYKLPTLQETEKHIKEKGHLPGIPSAAEVEKNGVELGDMNKKLLQKIEELTLYLIEMKKENEKVNVINKEYEKRLQRLENRLKK